MKKLQFIYFFFLLSLMPFSGKAQWLPQASGSSAMLQSVFFTDPVTGYCSGNGGVILKTTNGGANWISQNSGTTNDLFEVYFPAPDTGYAVGWLGTIVKTTDGGQNWGYALFRHYTSVQLFVFYRCQYRLCCGWFRITEHRIDNENDRWRAKLDTTNQWQLQAVVGGTFPGRGYRVCCWKYRYYSQDSRWWQCMVSSNKRDNKPPSLCTVY
ncbi:MAG: hypothetical protein IPP46_19845 [Bacteroidetes bacterium]|nr:hypothetical protein [Bacteroidota bacterium]